MYFSNNKLSKLLSLILVCAMLCTLFAGCKKEDDSTEPETSGSGLNLNLSDPETPTETTPPVETEATEPNENMGTITQQMNIRNLPSMQGIVIGTLYAGDRVEILRRETVVGHTWGLIETPVEGWIVMDYVEMDVPSANAPAATTPETDTPEATTPSNTTNIKGVITGNGLNIRSEASTSGKIQGSYNKGDVVTILETKDGWGRTEKGWIKMDYVNTSSTSTNTNTNTNTNTSTSTNTNTSTTITSNGSTTVVAKGVVKANDLNLRSGAGTNFERLGSLTYGDRVEILETDGSWGRTSKGWIHMDYIYKDGTKGTNSGTGTITGEGLNIRSGPGTGYGAVGSYSSGDRVDILEQFTYGNTTWGCTSKGWISMSYVDMDDSDDDDDDNGNENNSDISFTDSRKGMVTSGLNVREKAGTQYEVVGSYDEGDIITVLEAEDGWGRTSKGWISLNYVDFDYESGSLWG